MAMRLLLRLAPFRRIAMRAYVFFYGLMHYYLQLR